METKPMMIAVAATVVVIVIAAVLMPVLEDATETEVTFSNVNGSYASMVAIDSESDYTFTWDHSTPLKATVNDQEIDLFQGTVFCSTDTFVVRFGSGWSGYFIQFVPSDGLASISYSQGTGSADVSIVVSNGTATITRTPAGEGTGSETINTASISEGFGIAKTGDYVTKSPTQKAYLLPDSRIYSMGVTSISGDNAFNGFFIDGNSESVNVSQYNPDPATYTISNVLVNTEEVSGYVDLVQFSSITFKVTNISDTTKTADCTYNYVIVPAEVTAEKSVHLSANENAILLAIPALLIAAILIGILAVAFRMRD